MDDGDQDDGRLHRHLARRIPRPRHRAARGRVRTDPARARRERAQPARTQPLGGAVERRLALGHREAPLVERLADDHAGEVDLAQLAQRAQVLERRRSRPRRGSARAPPRATARTSSSVGPSSAAVAVGVRVDERARRRGRCRRPIASAAGSSVVSVQPAVAMLPAAHVDRDDDARRRRPRRSSSRKSTSRSAAVPTITRSAPARSASRTASTVRSPPPYCTGTPVPATIRAQVLERRPARPPWRRRGRRRAGSARPRRPTTRAASSGSSW